MSTVVILLVAHAITLATSATAHVVIVGTSPTANSILDAAPSRAEVRFDTGILDIGYAMVVRSDGGRTISTGAARRSRDSLSIALDPTAGPGSYTVGFRVVSADGHSVTSSFSYTVRGVRAMHSADAEATSSSIAVSPAAIETSVASTGAPTESPARWTPALLALVVVLGSVGAGLLGWSVLGGTTSRNP